MSNILCFGEALIDFLTSDQKQLDGLPLTTFTQFPGGAPANAAVAVAKLGGDAAFVGQVGGDMFGDFLLQALQTYGVNTQFVDQDPGLKTALAFVALDEFGERQFSFYRDNSADLNYRLDRSSSELFDQAKVLHFCSNTLTHAGITKSTAELIQQARNAQVRVCFDVNLRHNLWPQGRADREKVNVFVKMADVLKFSREEIDYLTSDIEDYIEQLLQGSASLVVITDDGNPIRYFTTHVTGTIEAPQVQVVDTTAGGDGFSGGLLYQLGEILDLSEVCQDAGKLRAVIGFAVHCGAHAVTRAGAFPALPKMSDVRHILPAFLAHKLQK